MFKISNEKDSFFYVVERISSGTSEKCPNGYNFIVISNKAKGMKFPEKAKLMVFGEILNVKKDDKIAFTGIRSFGISTDKYKDKDGNEKYSTSLSFNCEAGDIFVQENEKVNNETEKKDELEPIDDEELPF